MLHFLNQIKIKKNFFLNILIICWKNIDKMNGIYVIVEESGNMNWSNGLANNNVNAMPIRVARQFSGYGPIRRIPHRYPDRASATAYTRGNSGNQPVNSFKIFFFFF